MVIKGLNNIQLLLEKNIFRNVYKHLKINSPFYSNTMPFSHLMQNLMYSSTVVLLFVFSALNFNTSSKVSAMTVKL